MSATDFDGFRQALKANSSIIIWDKYPERFAYGTDASFYRLVPELVVQVQSEQDLQQVLSAARERSIALCFRAAGTSLSGQAVTDSVLVTLGSDWQGIRIDPLGEKVHLQPGVIGAHANNALAPYGRKIGPDPASINSCKIGGIAANNASGMCCGVAQNSYHTLAGMRLILADGSLLDTRDKESVSRFREQNSGLLNGLQQIIDQVRASEDLTGRIKKKYQIKNTMGYSLNSLLDYDDVLDVLTHLMIGSEGTLGFISEISYHTVPDEAFKAASIVAFDDLEECCRAVTALNQRPVSAVELIDYKGIQTATDNIRVWPLVQAVGESGAALLIDVRGETQEQLNQHIASVRECLTDYKIQAISEFEQNAEAYHDYWAFRKGLFPAVGAMREPGTTVIIEDVAFPIDQLAQGVEGLHQCFKKHGYDDALIFGHALAGNVHFVFSQAFNEQKEKDRYEAFMADIGNLVAAEFGGSLKAEHGTGRNMAPFVPLEWGQDAWKLMWSIKQLLDPENLLNPGVLLNEDPDCHLQHLKPVPLASETVDPCIECGFCEAICPSKNFSFTPRQRIAMKREIARLTASPQDARAKELVGLIKAYEGPAMDSCVATGMCAQRCPVNINTGDLVRQERTNLNSSWLWLAKLIRSGYPTLMWGTRVGLFSLNATSKIIGPERFRSLWHGSRKLLLGSIPSWYPAWPSAVRFRQVKLENDTKADFIYWPACVSQVMGPAPGDPDQRSQQEIIAILARRAGLIMHVPSSLSGQCCGQPFLSKGFFGEADKQRDDLVAELNAAGAPDVPVLSDTSPCALRLVDQPVAIVDSLTFMHQTLLPRLKIRKLDRKIALHVTCSARRNGQMNAAKAIAEACATDVILPPDIECCGFGGDKGFTMPELNTSALATLKSQVKDASRGYSSSRTCEMGLSEHSGIPYQSLLYLLEEASRESSGS